MHKEHAVNSTFHQSHLAEVIRVGDQLHQSFDGSAASQLLCSNNNKLVVDLLGRRMDVCKLLTEDAGNVLWCQTLPPNAHTLTFSNSLKWRFTTWPARLPPSSWLWLLEILQTAKTPFTDEHTISNSQPVRLVCISLW